MPKTVNIDKIEKGMVLYESVISNNGQVLISQGITLEEKHKKYFMMWGVDSVVVEGDDAAEEISYNSETITSAQNFVNELITWEPRNDNEKDMIQLAVINRTYKMINEDLDG